jgi:sucrose-6-phosphate hydrolase SacC (GH32 family)
MTDLRSIHSARPPGTIWSIGWLSGPSPMALRPDPGVRNPILTFEDVSDVRAAFVADPFLFRHDDRWHLVFEILEAESRRGVIGLATSTDARSWSYEGVVLREAFHLSYPHIFAEGPDLFMMPETLEPGRVRLYRAETIAGPWLLEAELIEGRWSDPTPFRYLGRWWLFVCQLNWRHDTLRLYHAPKLTGPWREHPSSPIIADDCRRARPAGRVIAWDGRLIRFAQDCVPAYGTAVRAFEILELTESTYVERPATPEVVLAAGEAPWMAGRVHHVDAQQVAHDRWVACIDGTTPLL